jgi:hypothetical protein
MTAREWIAAAAPDAPPGLSARVTEVLDAHPEWDALPVAEALTAAGADLLRAVLGAQGPEARASALDLLAADSCVTWAFEAAADEPDALPARAERAMQLVAEVAR